MRIIVVGMAVLLSLVGAQGAMNPHGNETSETNMTTDGGMPMNTATSTMSMQQNSAGMTERMMETETTMSMQSPVTSPTMMAQQTTEV